VEGRISLGIVNALRQHCAVIGADNDGAERIERIGLGRCDSQPHRRFVRCQRDGVEVYRWRRHRTRCRVANARGRAHQSPESSSRQHPIRPLHDKDQHGQDCQIKAKGRLLAVPLRRLPHLKPLAADHHEPK
jgi:hypothetical protein